jgi:hypothetical protein
MTGKPPRSYVPLDANYFRDVAVRKAGPNAELLYIRSLAFAKSSRTAGFVSRWDLVEFGSGLRGAEKLARILVEVGLWEDTEDGWFIRSWERWNAADKAVSAGGSLGNHIRWHVKKGRVESGCEHCEASPPDRPPIRGAITPESGLSSQQNRTEEKNPPYPPSDDRPHPTDAADPSAQQVVSDWIDTLKRRPPGAVIGQVARNVKTLLGEGFSPAEISQALAVMGTKGLNPSTLPSLVNEVVNKSNVRAIRSGVATSADGSRVKWVKPTERSRWREAYADEVCVGMYKIKYMNAGEQPA